MPAGLLGTAQCQGTEHRGQALTADPCWTDTLFTALSRLPHPHPAWSVPTSSAIFSSVARLIPRSEHWGGVADTSGLTPTRKETGTRKVWNTTEHLLQH